MLDGIQNGNDGKPEEDHGPEVPPDPAPAKEVLQNQAIIKDGVMDVRIYLENSDSAFACAIGSLDLAKDLVKNHFGQKALKEAARKAVMTSRIIKPSIS